MKIEAKMRKTAATLVFTLLLAAILLLTLIPGCGKNEAQPSPSVTASVPAGDKLSQADLQQIIADSTSAVKTATSYTFDMDMNMNVEATGGTNPGTMTMTMKTDGAFNIAAKQTQMNMDISMEADTLEDVNLGDTLQNMSAEMYLMTDTIYMKMNLPGMGERWVKMPVSDELEKQLNMDLVNQQLSPLQTATNIEFVKYESVEGSDCYVIKIVPSFDQMKQYLEDNQMSGSAFDWSKISNLDDLFNSLSYNVWIARDTKQMKKMTCSMNMKVTPEELGADSGEIENAAMAIEITMHIRDYNTTVSITLPEDAQNATEMPGM